MTDSRQLLADYSRNHSESAFRELVTRYLDLVYSTALRLVDGDAHRAEDVAQIVFTDLAKMARGFAPEVMLGGWLHRHTCFVAANTMRGERRRLLRERQAIEMNLLQNDFGADFSRVAPILDEAINELNEADRTAILLRFFEQQDFRSVGKSLESSEDAARMRVNRALEQLRELLHRRGITTTSAALSLVISANAVQAAPVGLAVTISAAALAGAAVSTATATTTIAAATKTIAMTTLQKTLVTVTVVVLAGAGVYEARQAAKLRDQNQSLQQQQASVAQRIGRLEVKLSDATNVVAGLHEENERLNRNTSELLRLRAEVGSLRTQNRQLAEANSRRPVEKSPPNLSSGFGELGDYLAAGNVADAGEDTPENLLRTFIWAVRENRIKRLESIGAPLTGQSDVGESAGEISKAHMEAFKLIQKAFTNAEGFQLSSKASEDLMSYDVRLDSVMSQTNDFMKSLNLSFHLEQTQNGWRFGTPP